MNRFYAFLLLLVGLAVGIGCSSDPDTPLGSSFIDDSLIQSRPGTVLEDTLYIGPTNASYEYNAFYSSFLTLPNQMFFGRLEDFESWMLLRADFSTADAETLKTVTSAYLQLTTVPISVSGAVGALFYELDEPFANGDTMTSLTLGPVIPDGTGQNDRTMQSSPRTYTLPDTLVQQWIQGKSQNGIAIVLNDTTTTTRLPFGTSTNSEYPYLKAFFSDQTDTTYYFAANGTFTKDLAPTSNLRLSDGDTRRIWLPVDLSTFDTQTILHQAKLVLHVVPGSATETGGTVELYSPTDSVAGGSGIGSGQTIARAQLDSDVVVFSIRTVIAAFIADSTLNHGLALKYYPEGNSIRRIEFYSSSAPDSLRPQMEFTFSTAPTFPSDDL